MRHGSNCRKGLHSFGEKSDAGAGIGRQVCTKCGYVIIELRDEAEVEDSKLFAPARHDSMFAIQTAVENFELREQRFGVRSPRKSVPSDIS